MRKDKQQLPDYRSIIGEGTEIEGKIRFAGALHIDGKVIGDVSESSDECALTLGQSGVIEGNVDVAHVMLDGTIKGDVRATQTPWPQSQGERKEQTGDGKDPTRKAALNKTIEDKTADNKVGLR